MQLLPLVSFGRLWNSSRSVILFSDGEETMVIRAEAEDFETRRMQRRKADVLRDPCPGTSGHILARPLWGTVHRTAGDRDNVALGDATGSGRAPWSAPADCPS